MRTAKQTYRINLLAQDLSVKLLALHVVTRETVLGVGDEKTTIRSTLHGTEDTGASGGTVKTDIQVGLEGAAFLTVDLSALGKGELSIGSLNTSEGLVELQLGEGAASQEEAGSVGSGPVGETMLDAVPGELVGVGGSEYLVADNLGRDDLADNLYSRR